MFSCVGNDKDLRSVTLGKDGAFAGMKKGAIFIDNTTASADIARELDAAAAAGGFGFLDAPVSGGQAGAVNGVLTVMIGGKKETFDRAQPVIAHFARMTTLIGPAGAGQLTKMVNQICIAGLVQGLSEGVHFAQKAGLDIPAVMETIAKGAAGSWQMENRWKTMEAGKFDFGFAVDWMRKDLDIALTESRRNGASLPVAAIVDQFYSEVQKMGGSRWDTSSLVRPPQQRGQEVMADGTAAAVQPSPREVITYMAGRNAVFRFLQIEVLEAERGRSKFAAVVRPEVTNTFDTMHGGMIFALADMTFGFTCNAYNEKAVTAGATIEMLYSPKVGDRVISEAREIYREGRNSIIDVTLWIDGPPDDRRARSWLRCAAACASSADQVMETRAVTFEADPCADR